MKALVTGGSGFIGSTLIERLSAQGFEVHALMRRSSSDANLKGLSYRRVEGDITDAESLKSAAKGMTHIFHLAGTTAAPNRDAYLEFNAKGTENLARAAAEAGGITRFVFVSSLAAAGPAPALESPRREGEADQPVSAYGESKLEAERRLLKLKDAFPIAIIRPPMVYGPKDKAVLTIIRTVAKGLMPLIQGKAPGGHKHYSAIHSVDLCQGIIQAGTKPGLASGELFYLTGDGTYTYQELLSTIAGHLGGKPLRLKVPQAAVRMIALALTGAGKLTGKTYPLNLDKLHEILPDYWICSNAKAKNLLGFTPEYDLSSGMADAITWYKKHGWV